MLNNALSGAVNRVKDCVEDRAAGIKEKLTRVINKAVRGKGKGKGKSPFSNQRTFDPSIRVVDSQISLSQANLRTIFGKYCLMP